jgi:hypothetical protein
MHHAACDQRQARLTTSYKAGYSAARHNLLFIKHFNTALQIRNRNYLWFFFFLQTPPKPRTFLSPIFNYSVLNQASVRHGLF